MIVLAPIIFVVSLVVAYLVVGNAFRPVDQLINEVEAITDGRSLHRRLPADSSNDELSRLGLTVNAMLTRLETSFAALRRFTADASHELKTPLTVLRADVERAMHPATNRADTHGRARGGAAGDGAHVGSRRQPAHAGARRRRALRHLPRRRSSSSRSCARSTRRR